MTNFSVSSHLTNQFRLMTGLIIHYACIWPVIGRIYYISNLIEFNHSFIVNDINPKYNNFQIYEKGLDVKNKILNEERNEFSTKITIMPWFLIFFLLIFLQFLGLFWNNYKYVLCYIYAFVNMVDTFETFKSENCLNYLDSNLIYTFLSSLKYFLDFCLTLVQMTLIFKSLRHKLKNDYLNLKFEMCSLFLIWYIIDNSYHMLKFFFPDLDHLYDFLYLFYTVDSSINYLYVILYFYLTKRWEKISQVEFYQNLNNFRLFMKTPSYFCYFKDHLKNIHYSQFYFLLFWKQYSIYKQNFNLNSKEKNQQTAVYFYQVYFQEKPLDVRSSYSLKTDNWSMCIEIPEYKKHKIDQAAKSNFEVDNLENIYDEIYEEVDNELQESYKNMIKIQEHYENLKNLIGMVEFEIIRENRNLRDSLSNICYLEN